MGVNAVKGVEIGEGFGAARLKGSENRDCMERSGIDGGISTGRPIVVRAAFKPTSSIGIKRRHDPCVAIRGAPVVEAMVALVLAGAALEKFGGDSVAETRRNHDAYLAALRS